jgi:AraC-like DNA-binding protein
VADLVPAPAAVLARLPALGVDVARLLRHVDVPRSRLEDAKSYVTTAEFFAIWRALDEIGAPRDIGLSIGGTAHPYQQNVASLAALHSASLGEALEKLARYKRLVCPELITVNVVRGEARISFEWLLSDQVPPRLLIDGVFASVALLARRGTGQPFVPRRIELARRRADEAMLRRHFGCDVRFDAPADLFVFDAKLLAAPFVTHNAALLDLIVPGLEAALLEGGGARTLADDVRTVLSRRICGERPAVEKVAKALGMSPRTLQRRLEEIGTSYQKLLDDVRRRSARRLLADTDLAPAEVAFLLGFEEQNSFSRAFHAWEGTTPARWRESVERDLR